MDILIFCFCIVCVCMCNLLLAGYVTVQGGKVMMVTMVYNIRLTSNIDFLKKKKKKKKFEKLKN